MIKKHVQKIGKSAMRLVVNDMPAKLINASYNTYSKIYKGQINLGLPVSRELIITQEEVRCDAIGKLALTLYHIFIRAAETRIPRDQIKVVISDELEKGRLRLTENVILLATDELTFLASKRFHINKRFIPKIKKEATRRRILKESIKIDAQPAYFESKIDEIENNGRGDYETVYYRDFTDEGKEIGFRRIVSMEDVTAGDNRPSVIMVPGFANNSDCFNISNRYSIAKDFADMGSWVYLFDPRGVGVNEGRFDPYYTVDTLIDYDLPTVVKFISSRSGGKPSILMGHSMGGVVCENMVLNWSIRQNLDKIEGFDSELKDSLDTILVAKEEAASYLSMVKGIVSLGSPKFFNKTSHVFFPAALWLNHLSRIFKFSQVPVQEFSRVVTELPVLKEITRFLSNNNIGDLNFLISPENHTEDKYFVERYLKSATESIPLGLGFQCLKSVYDGKGFKRMDHSHLNYSDCFACFPEDIPIFHFWGSKDYLAPLDNMRYSEDYPHRIKKVYHLETVADLKKVEILDERSQLIDFVIEGANHLDLLYGKTAIELVYPILNQIVEKVWGGWSYDTAVSKAG